MATQPHRGPDKPPDRDRIIVDQLCAWFAGAARALPWRESPRDPYKALVSELMLQQTQVSRVLEKFGPFIQAFPTVRDLAQADEGRVLAAWSGLGYYRRARLLHAAAKAIADRFDAAIPADAALLQTLPGIGRYTAGAIASIAFNEPVPIVDGNVARVLIRLDAQELRHASPEAMAWAWQRAETLCALTINASSPITTARFNEGLMELGATICTPAAPKCLMCPLATHCQAAATGNAERLPLPKTPAKRSAICHSCVVLTSGGRVYLQRRPAKGLWATMWQPPTLEGPKPAAKSALAALLNLRPATLQPAPGFTFATTHRDVAFSIWIATTDADPPPMPGETSTQSGWFTALELASLGLSNAHRKVLAAAGFSGL